MQLRIGHVRILEFYFYQSFIQEIIRTSIPWSWAATNQHSGLDPPNVRTIYRFSINFRELTLIFRLSRWSSTLLTTYLLSEEHWWVCPLFEIAKCCTLWAWNYYMDSTPFTGFITSAGYIGCSKDTNNDDCYNRKKKRCSDQVPSLRTPSTTSFLINSKRESQASLIVSSQHNECSFRMGSQRLTRSSRCCHF